MEEGIISKWLVTEGANVKSGQPILEIETDKINAQIEAPADGVLGGIVAREGQAIKVQGLLAYVLAPGEQVPASPLPGPVTAQPPRPVEGAAERLRLSAVEEVRASVTEPGFAAPATRPTNGRLRVSPLARKLAKELGVDVARLAGSGPGGRVIEKDVRAAAAAPAPAPAALPPLPAEGAAERLRRSAGQGVRAPSPAVAAALPTIEALPAGSVIPLRGVRRVVAERMTQSLREMAQLTLTIEADATNLHQLRTQLAAQYEARLGFKIAYNDLLVRICARALAEHPRLNATIVGDEIRLLEGINIGVAVEQGQDLVVPNIKHADRKGLVEIATEFRGKVERARSNQLTLEDITGGTFTITNLGQHGIDAFTPIVNPPEAAILGVGRLAEKPAVVNSQVVPRMSMTLSLTIDHRVVDGAPGARFLARVNELIEQPYLLL